VPTAKFANGNKNSHVPIDASFCMVYYQLKSNAEGVYLSMLSFENTKEARTTDTASLIQVQIRYSIDVNFVEEMFNVSSDVYFCGIAVG